MDVTPLALPEVLLIRPRRHGDHRGYFCEVYSRRDFQQAGIGHDFVQDNHSLSAEPFTVRALHFQTPPHAQTKLVRCSAGRILDVAVDVRRGSATFGRFVTAELSAENGAMLLIPGGFAHGLCTLVAGTQVQYKVDAYYAPASDAGIFWADPALGIGWPVGPDKAIVSGKDARLPRLADAPVLF
jgi:dTDP-4-dehydrorhamnose 3,5-epimerase